MTRLLPMSTPAGATLAALDETYWEVTTMGAYDTPRLRLTAQRSASSEIKEAGGLSVSATDSLLDVMIDQIAERVAQRLAALVDRSSTTEDGRDDEWFDSRHAANYLGIHRDTLR
jgi:hypothetical protein